MSACCDGSLGDSCRCKCHEPGESAPMVMDTMAGGGRYMLGPIMEGAPVSHVEFGVIGHVEGGKVRITDPGVLESLAAGEPLEVSVGPVAPPADWVIAGTADCGFTWPDHRFGCINE